MQTYNPSVPWFVGGLVLLILFASYAPKLAGGVVVLLVVVLALELSPKITST